MKIISLFMFLKSQSITTAQYSESWFWKKDYVLSLDLNLNESEHTWAPGTGLLHHIFIAVGTNALTRQ